MTYSTTLFDLQECGVELDSLISSREAAGNPIGENETIYVVVDGDNIEAGTCREGMGRIDNDDAVIFLDRIEDLKGAHRAEDVEFSAIPW